MRGDVDIHIAYGAARTVTLTLRDDTSPFPAVDVSGYTGELRLSRYDSSPHGVTVLAVACVVDGPAGTFTASVSGAQSTALAATFGDPVPNQNGRWSLWVTPPAGTAFPAGHGWVKYLQLGEVVDATALETYEHDFAASITAYAPAGPPGSAGPAGPAGPQALSDVAGNAVQPDTGLFQCDDYLEVFKDPADGRAHLCVRKNIRNWKYRAWASTEQFPYTTITTTDGSNVATMANARDFARRHGVIIFERGSDPGLTTPPAPVCTLKTWKNADGTTDPVTNGTVKMRVKICARDRDFACSAASAEVQVDACPEWFGRASTIEVRNISACLETNVPDQTNLSRIVDGRRVKAGETDNTVLLTGMTDKTKNGGYQISNASSGAINAGTMSLTTRATIMDTLAENALGVSIRIMNGVKRRHSYWRVSKAPTTLGSSDIEIVPETYLEVTIPVIEVASCATGNLTLSGLQTVNGVAGAVDRPVLAHLQNDPSENDVYLMKSGAWVRLGTVALGSVVRVGVLAAGKTTLATDWGAYYYCYAASPFRFRKERRKHYDVFGSFSYDGGSSWSTYAPVSSMLAEPELAHLPRANFRGEGSPGVPFGVQATPPAGTVRGALRTRIRSVSGLTVTLADNVTGSGSATMHHDSSLAFYEWMADCSPAGSPAALTLEWPGSAGVYHFWNDMVLDKVARLSGDNAQSSTLQMGTGCGLITETQHTSENGSSASWAHIEFLGLRGQTIKLVPEGRHFIDEEGKTQGAMVNCRTTTIMQFCIIQRTTGAAYALKADSVNNTNANRSRVDFVLASGTEFGDGFYIGGDNANAVLLLQPDASNVRGHGVRQTNLLGANIISPHFIACHGNPIYADGGATVVVGPYTEQGQGEITGEGSMLVLGGGNYSGVDDSRGDLYLATNYCSPLQVICGAVDSLDLYKIAVGSRVSTEFEKITRQLDCSKPIGYERAHNGNGDIIENLGTTVYRTGIVAGNDVKRSGLMNFPDGFTIGTGARKRRFAPLLAALTAPLGKWDPGDLLVDIDGKVYTPASAFGIGAVWTNRSCRLGDVVYPTAAWDAAHPGHNSRAWYVASFTGGTTVDSATIGPTEPDWTTSDTAGSNITVGGCVLTPLAPNSRTTALTQVAP